ncbi:MAG: hypothetical protein ABSB67_04920 [Bryobacteraceae bacterium]|jgi:hypothetical protein
MMEITDTSPVVHVEPAEYIRLLGYPQGWVLEGRARELDDWARDWYAQNGRPWLYAREAESFELDGAAIRIEDAEFASSRLRQTLEKAEAHSLIVAAVSAGPELEAEAGKRWDAGCPDEYFFLEAFGSAVVERLTMLAGSRLCEWAESQGMAVLPHYSPGYPEWDILEQPRFLELLTRHGSLPSSINALDSGALRPKKSLLAAFGVTRHTERLRRLTELVPCENCSLGGCQYRRAAHLRPLDVTSLNGDAKYAVNSKALKRWAEERLSLHPREDGGIDALFRYDGTTCTNMGRPLAFHYNISLGPREAGFPIRDQRCAPAPGDRGHTYMCEFIREGSGLLLEIAGEKPLLGRPLNEVLAWTRSSSPAGCYCDPESREHKWGLVLETVHYALARMQSPDQSS